MHILFELDYVFLVLLYCTNVSRGLARPAHFIYASGTLLAVFLLVWIAGVALCSW